MSEAEDDWTVQILAPEPAVPSTEYRAGRPFNEYSLSGPSRRGGRVVDASVDAIKANWQETIQKLTEIGDGIDDDAAGWGVSEIEVGLTLSAKGQLLFIAEASAEASVKITLTRRPA
ncbi:hypothetical protein [Microbacterium sp. K24]|uniref:Pepco domain-containing protein n=1 Tax=Microbacterium sp. K24 TaxID=2305446 RepID=UPI00109D151E|nr:hypothetical protein [Microbacterium sp. K24]